MWLGGYHGITAENSACSEADYCLQRRQIEKAFYLCTGLGSWRFVYSWLFNLDRVFAEQAVTGLIDIDKRGWWESLWVIQEMALAIGRVLLQCGKSVCHYNLYCAMRLKMIERFDNMTDLQRTSAAAMQTFVKITELFRYPEDLLPTGSLIRLWLVQLISRAAGQERRQQFRKQNLALRLQYILLKTSNHFTCRDVQDRLYGVLGIAGGSIVGTKNRALPDFVLRLGRDNTRFQLVALGRGLTRLHILLFIWDQSYTWIAQYWPIFRPQFVIKDQKEVHEAIARSSRDSHDKAQFFMALAQYLGTRTGRLSILDCANCMVDQDFQAPSWPPVWTRPIDHDAYVFAISQDYVPPDKFHFSTDSRTLTLQGRT